MVPASGAVDLSELHTFARADVLGSALHGNSPEGRAYSKIVAQVTANIARMQGFYLWGYYDRRGLWRNLYLGKAGFGKTAHLHARIKEELRDERWFLWSGLMPPEQLDEIGLRSYPAQWERQYRSMVARSVRKEGARMIVWAATPDINGQAVVEVESDLIETLNPTANQSRPIPPHALQVYTPQIIAAFRHYIHVHRPT